MSVFIANFSKSTKYFKVRESFQLALHRSTQDKSRQLLLISSKPIKKKKTHKNKY